MRGRRDERRQHDMRRGDGPRDRRVGSVRHPKHVDCAVARGILDEPGDAQLLQDFQLHVQRWPGPVKRVKLAGEKPSLREPARNPSTPLNLSRRRAGLGGNVISYIQVASTSSLTVARGKSRRSRGVDDVSGPWAAPGGSTSYRQPRQAIHGV